MATDEAQFDVDIVPPAPKQSKTNQITTAESLEDPPV